MAMVDDDDMISNASANETMDDVIAARVSRRSVLGGGLAAAGTAMLGIDALLRSVPVSAHGGDRRRRLLGFDGIPVSSADTVVVPAGYTAKVLISWGDPISDGPAFEQDASNSAADQAKQWGMHNDGVVFFPMERGGYGGSGRDSGLLVQNHEYADDVLLFTDGTANWSAAKTAKSQNAHGVSVIELRKERVRRGGRHGRDEYEWKVVRPSRYARRITAQTPIKIGGPAAGDPRLKTSADPSGRRVLGTLNNCAMGYTPWGTYLACEENFNGYFRKNGDADRARGALRHQRRWQRLAVAHDRHAVRGRHRAQRGQPVRLGHRDRPVRPDAPRR